MQEFDEMYNLYSENVYKFILKLCGNTFIAEEIMQETFYKAIKNADKFKGNCKISTWLCSIARNEYINYVKRKDNNNVHDDVTYMQDKFDMENMFEEKDKALRIHLAMHNLSEPYKEIFSLRVMGELSFADIGRIFEKSENWARVTFFRAKGKIVELLKEDGYEM